jgi:hypothetical protein
MRGKLSTGILALLAIAQFGSTAIAQQRKANILILWGDDIGWYNISAYKLGVMGYRTPNIDRVGGRAPRASEEASRQ